MLNFYIKNSMEILLFIVFIIIQMQLFMLKKCIKTPIKKAIKYFKLVLVFAINIQNKSHTSNKYLNNFNIFNVKIN